MTGGSHQAPRGRHSAPAPAPEARRSATAPLPAARRRTSASRRGSSRRGSSTTVLSNVLLIVGVALLLGALGMWGLSQWRYHKQAQVNEELAVYATVSEKESQAPKVDWAGLKAVNDEVVGWLQVSGTTINYPVYQASDNERYLRHSATGEWTLGGQLFVDYECTRPGMVDPLTIIYGHHLLDGSMFEQIAAMDDQAHFDEIKTVWYVTEDVAWECEPLFVFYCQETDQEVRTFTFDGDEAFHKFLAKRLADAPSRRADAEQVLEGTKHALCLMTCNYLSEYGGHGRTVLVCVPKSEPTV